MQALSGTTEMQLLGQRHEIAKSPQIDHRSSLSVIA
jgi:hypothetical protein